MSTIDRQRTEAVRTLERSGYTFNGIEWVAPARTPADVPALVEQADAMHALLLLLADRLGGCGEGSEGADDLEMTVAAIEAYEAQRWPNGRTDGGKG